MNNYCHTREFSSSMCTINPWSRTILQKKSIEEIQIMTTVEITETKISYIYLINVSSWRIHFEKETFFSLFECFQEGTNVYITPGCVMPEVLGKCWHSFFLFFLSEMLSFSTLLFFLNNIKCHQLLWQLAASCTKEKLHNGQESSG